MTQSDTGTLLHPRPRLYSSPFFHIECRRRTSSSAVPHRVGEKETRLPPRPPSDSEELGSMKSARVSEQRTRPSPLASATAPSPPASFPFSFLHMTPETELARFRSQ